MSNDFIVGFLHSEILTGKISYLTKKNIQSQVFSPTITAHSHFGHIRWLDNRQITR